MFQISRRSLLQSAPLGFGWLAVQNMLGQSLLASEKGKPQPHFPATAKHVIFLCMRGAPSHVDTFDYKPKLTADNGKPGRRQGTKLLGSLWKFAQHGQSGLWISELFPELAKQADKLCLLRSLHTELPAHPKRSCDCILARRSSSGHRWVPGRCMDWAAKMRTCRDL